MNTPSLEEQQAVARLKKGDLSGLEPLVRKYQVKAVYAAYLIVQSMPLAEDIAQTAFLHASEMIHQFDDSRPFSAWFMQSVVHDAIKATRRQKREVPLEVEDEERQSLQIDQLLEPQLGPEEQYDAEETRQAVWQALQALSPEQRGAVVMHHFLKMDAKEIAEALTGVRERPVSTVYWWLRDARKRLKILLQSFWVASHDLEERQD